MKCRKCGREMPWAFIVCPWDHSTGSILTVGLFLTLVGLFYVVFALRGPNDSFDILLKGFMVVSTTSLGYLSLREWYIVRKNPGEYTAQDLLDRFRFCPKCGKAFVPPASNCLDCGVSLKGIS